MKHRALVLVGLLMLLVVTVLAADDDRTPTTRTNPPGMPQEGYSPRNLSAPTVPAELEDALKKAMEDGNGQEAQRIGQLMKAYLPPAPARKVAVEADQQIENQFQAAFGPVWTTNDITVYTGSVKYLGTPARQIDLKKGEDGNLYLAVNRTNVTSYTAWAQVYKSTNGGATWTAISGGGVASTTAYFGEISMLVECRSVSNFDSTRIVLFYTRSSASAMTSATIRYASFLRDGSAFMGGASEIETPLAGRKFGSPSGFSDGAYYSTATYLGLVAAEYSNDGDSTKSLRYYRSTDWGTTWAGATFPATYQDWYPTAALKPGSAASTDSVYIATERRFSPTNSLVRVTAAKFNPPTSDAITYYLPPVDGTSRYERPTINIRQTGRAYGTSREVLITVVKNGKGQYHSLRLTGPDWVLDSDLASGVNVAHTFCASDSLTAGSGYFLAAYTDASGDTLGVRRGVLGSLGTRIYRNSYKTSTTVQPACAIYKQGTSKYSAYAYAGLGPINVYFNQENLPATAVKTDGPLPLEYGLDQNYPNPFNPETFIGFRVAQAGPVKLQVFDLLGREVAVLVNEQKDAGGYQVRFDASGLPSGVYLYRLTAGTYVDAKKLVLVR